MNRHPFASDLYHLIKMYDHFACQQTVFRGIWFTLTCSHNSASRASKSSCSEEAGEQEAWLRFKQLDQRWHRLIHEMMKAIKNIAFNVT